MSSSFVDKVDISVAAGDGGNGAVSFHREKYIAAGGPDGGDGGRGGDVIFLVDDHMSTLMDFRFKRKYAAGNGRNGQGKRCAGKDGESLVIRVPRGTLIRDRKTGAIIKDMSDSEPFVAARGGRGGWGNRRFATPTRQAPRFARPGLPGERLELTLELKLLADVGLVGFPNAGKSTLLSVVSKARPKIADYPFTTLYPNLGVVYVEDGVSFVLADIPGIIEGASGGAGLGHDFLRHIDRCRLLIHVVDASASGGRDPVEDFETVNRELAAYSPELAKRPQLVAANKCDLLEESREPLLRLRARADALGYPFFEISAATTAGVFTLMRAAAGRLAALPPVRVFEPDFVPEESERGGPEDLTIERVEGLWIVEGRWLDRLIAGVNFSDHESRMYFDRTLRAAGVYERMEALGVRDGDSVSLGGMEFEYKV